jgi:hypothetical protein
MAGTERGTSHASSMTLRPPFSMPKARCSPHSRPYIVGRWTNLCLFRIICQVSFRVQLRDQTHRFRTNHGNSVDHLWRSLNA